MLDDLFHYHKQHQICFEYKDEYVYILSILWITSVYLIPAIINLIIKIIYYLFIPTKQIILTPINKHNRSISSPIKNNNNNNNNNIVNNHATKDQQQQQQPEEYVAPPPYNPNNINYELKGGIISKLFYYISSYVISSFYHFGKDSIFQCSRQCRWFTVMIFSCILFMFSSGVVGYLLWNYYYVSPAPFIINNNDHHHHNNDNNYLKNTIIENVSFLNRVYNMVSNSRNN